MYFLSLSLPLSIHRIHHLLSLLLLWPSFLRLGFFFLLPPSSESFSVTPKILRCSSGVRNLLPFFQRSFFYLLLFFVFMPVFVVVMFVIAPSSGIVCAASRFHLRPKTAAKPRGRRFFFSFWPYSVIYYNCWYGWLFNNADRASEINVTMIASRRSFSTCSVRELHSDGI